MSARLRSVLADGRAVVGRVLGRAAPGSRPDPVDGVLSAFARATSGRSVSFVQVGSNDGATGDPLRALAERCDWSGLLVEPVPYVFARLTATLGNDPRLRLENAAITDHDGEADFFHLRERREGEELPEWYDQLGSFSLPTILSHEDEIPALRELLVTTRVRTLSFDSLCARHGLERFDLLHIDTEGYDWEILKRVDLARYQPAVVLFEHAHLGAEAASATQEHMVASGYAWQEATYDTICVRRSALDALPGLAAAWESSAAT